MTFSIDSMLDANKVQQTLMTDLHKLREFSQKLNLTKSVELITELLQRMGDKKFSVAIVGEFRRGKSTFINALLGKSILPSDVLPTTATLNRVTYGVTPSVKITFKDGHEEQIPIENLTDYVTKLTPESEMKAEAIQEAVVYYPIPYCQNNIEVIDTPGLNDDQNMTEVTLSVLPQVDAAIMIILAQAPFSEFERDLLENRILPNDLGRVIFVVNIWESYTPEQAERIRENIKGRIQKYVLDRAVEDFGEDSQEHKIYRQKIGEPKVFGVNVKQALEGKEKGDESLLIQSGFKSFELALDKFLTQERAVILLQVPLNRTMTSAQEILSTLSIRESALQMQQAQFKEAYQKSMAEITAVRERQKQEIQLIDGAAAKVKLLVSPLIYNLPGELKQAAEAAIQSTPIEARDLNNQKALTKKLGEQVSNAVQRSGNKLSEKIQHEIQKGIDREVDRLKDFVISVEKALANVEMVFDIPASPDRKTTTTGEAITAAISVFTGFGGIWSGYRVAGLKGAAVGAGGSLATFFAGGVIAGLVGAPVTVPLVLAVAIGSVFTGGGLAKAVFRKDRVENFRNDYKEKVLAEIEKQIRQQRLEQQIDERISNAFDLLKETLRQEVNALLDNTQQTLTELSDKRGRNEALTEAERKEINEIRTETERILGNAQRLSEQLVEIMSV